MVLKIYSILYFIIQNQNYTIYIYFIIKIFIFIIQTLLWFLFGESVNFIFYVISTLSIYILMDIHKCQLFRFFFSHSYPSLKQP
jgi:hypothetical protein